MKKIPIGLLFPPHDAPPVSDERPQWTNTPFFNRHFFALFTSQLHAALFQSYTAYATGSHPESVAIGDLNGDGRKDVAMCTSSTGNTNDNSVLIFFQNVSNQFNAPVRYAAGASAYSVVIANFNGDRRIDFAVGKDRRLRLLKGLTSGFTNFTDYPTSYPI